MPWRGATRTPVHRSRRPPHQRLSCRRNANPRAPSSSPESRTTSAGRIFPATTTTGRCRSAPSPTSRRPTGTAQGNRERGRGEHRRAGRERKFNPQTIMTREDEAVILHSEDLRDVSFQTTIGVVTNRIKLGTIRRSFPTGGSDLRYRRSDQSAERDRLQLKLPCTRSRYCHLLRSGRDCVLCKSHLI